VGRSLRASFVLAAALGLSGCLLFTDPINKAPVVKIVQVTDEVVRDIPAKFTATVSDDNDSPASLLLEWAEFKSSQLPYCSWITPATRDSQYKSTTLDSFEPYTFTTDSPDRVCVCARTTDHNGATGLGCSKAIIPVNPTPVATIEDVSGNPSGQTRPLCSKVHLSAEGSTFPTGDQLQPGEQVQFNWSLQYTGADSAGKSVQLSKCADLATGQSDQQHQCFYAAGPGTYTVTLSITDSLGSTGTPTTTSTSETATFVVPVNVDTPPCLQRTDPDVYSQRILLSRNADLGGTYQSRTFTVLGVADDCNPYPSVPLLGGNTSSPPVFVWSVLDSTQHSPSWIQQVNATTSFTVSQVMFPNARPGDTIGLRVEVRDQAVQDSLRSGGQVCSVNPPDTSPAICCGDACGTPNDCVRWTTWTVQFQP